MPHLAIVMYACEVAGERTESIDVQIRNFDSANRAQLEQRLRSEPTNSYTNESGELVSWPFLRLAAAEEFARPQDGAELISFIADHREIGQWLRSDVPPGQIK